MSAKFEIPYWMASPTPPPPPPETDPHRVEAMVNDFIAAKQDALFDAPDAFYRRTGADAVDEAPPLLDRLTALRQSMLDEARHDGERALLGPRLDLHVDDARDGIDRHVTKQRDVFARQVIGERQTLIRRAAELEHTNDDKLAALAEAHASTAEELARMNGEPAQPAAERARSAIWRTALDRRLANGDGAPALALFDRIKGRLTLNDRRALDGQMAPVALDAATDAWIVREDARPGEPLDARAAADPALSPLERATVRAKVAVRDSHRESRRVATVMGTDDRLADAIRAIATAPATYKPYTIAGLVRAYDEAGEPEKAASTRQLALLEGALLPFARSSADRQQAFIDSLPEGEPLRAAAETIQRHQAEAFARDAYAAGTVLYPDVGPALPLEDKAGRLRQMRMIEARRGPPSDTNVRDAIASSGSDRESKPVNFSPDDAVGVRPRAPQEDDAGRTGSPAVQVAEETFDYLPANGASRRGAAPAVEPPSNDPDLEKAFEAWPGVQITLPNGRGIEDPNSPTGYVMGPFNDLKEVAEAGRRERLNAAVSPVETLRRYLAQGGVFDHQRRSYRYGKDGFTQLRQFRNVANVNVGLFAQKLGLPLWLTLRIAGEYASKNSSNAKPDEPFKLDPQTMEYIVVGYHLGDDGIIE
jgi:hypothetical protein